MRIILTPEAERDVLEAAGRYGLHKNRRRQTFDDALEEACKKIATNPNRGTLLGERYRRIRMNRFPYGVLYRHEEEEIIITAVMYLRRHPSAWSARMNLE